METAELGVSGWPSGHAAGRDGSARPWRVKTRPACFINYSVMQKLTEGYMLSDIVAIIGSINVVAAELDR